MMLSLSVWKTTIASMLSTGFSQKATELGVYLCIPRRLLTWTIVALMRGICWPAGRGRLMFRLNPWTGRLA